MKKIILILLCLLAVVHSQGKGKKCRKSAVAVISFLSEDLSNGAKIKMSVTSMFPSNGSYHVLPSATIEDLNELDAFSKFEIAGMVRNKKCILRLEGLSDTKRVNVSFFNTDGSDKGGFLYSYKGRLINPFNNLELFVHPDDRVKIEEKNGFCSFTGRGAKTMECQFKLACAYSNDPPLKTPESEETVLQFFNTIDSLTREKLNILSCYRHEIPLNDFLLIKLRLIERCQTIKTRAIDRLPGGYRNTLLCSRLRSTFKNYIDPIWTDSIKISFKTNQVLLRSFDYLYLISDTQLMFDLCLQKGKPYDVKTFYKFVKNNYRGSSRDWLIFSIVRRFFTFQMETGDVGDIGGCINDAIKSNVVTNPAIVKYFKFLLKSNIPGQFAYNFSLPDLSGKMVHLADFEGKVVLLDFYFEHCSSCAAIHPYLDAIKNTFMDSKFVIISIFWDTKRVSKAKWKDIVDSKVYTCNNEVNLIAQVTSNGKQPEIIRRLAGQIGGGFLVYIGKDGRYLRAPLSPTEDNGQAAIAFIKKNL